MGQTTQRHSSLVCMVCFHQDHPNQPLPPQDQLLLCLDHHGMTTHCFLCCRPYSDGGGQGSCFECGFWTCTDCEERCCDD